jgi:hypothetical protein
MPGTISGPTNTCPYITSGNNAIYSINKVNNAIGYQWALSDVVNSHIISHAGTGINDTAIVVHFDGGFTSGTISVNAIGLCGNSAAKILNVSTLAPATPQTITGDLLPCPGTTVTYTATPLTAGSYVWTVPATATFTGQGTNTIIVTYGPSFMNGSITVKVVSPCGTSAIKSVLVYRCKPKCPTHNPTDGDGIVGLSDYNQVTTAQSKILSIYPNPSRGDFYLSVSQKQIPADQVVNKPISSAARVNILNEMGQIVYTTILKNVSFLENIPIHSKLPTGVYMVHCIMEGKTYTRRLFIDQQH